MLVLTTSVVLAVAIFACWCIVSGKAKGAQRSMEFFVVTSCASPVSRTVASKYAKAWGGLLAFDILIFALTVYKSLVLRIRSGSSLLTLILRDGSMYFGVMAACNVANILTYMYGGIFTRGIGTTFVNNLSSVMMTRLMLNMRDPKLLAGSQRSPMRMDSFHPPENFSTLVDPGTEIDGGSRYVHHFSAT